MCEELTMVENVAKENQSDCLATILCKEPDSS